MRLVLLPVLTLGYALTCSGEASEIRCAFGGIDLTAVADATGTSFAGSWAGMACADVWSGTFED